MSINRRNSEMYYDPTAYEALSRVDREEQAKQNRPLVYMAVGAAEEFLDLQLADAESQVEIAMQALEIWD